MAKFTELLAEYLKGGGEIPAAFDIIEGLKDLFVGKYIEREIGFETPALFYIKLEYKANLIIPVYQQRITDLQNSYAAQQNPIKKRIKSGAIKRDYGQRVNTNQTPKQMTENRSIDLPTTGTITVGNIPTNVQQTTTDELTITNTSNTYSDNETYQNVTDTEEGTTLSEALQRLQNAEREGVKNLMNELLNEFEPLFMGVW